MDESIVLPSPTFAEWLSALNEVAPLAAKAALAVLLELRHDRRKLLPDGPNPNKALLIFGEGGEGMIFLTVESDVIIAADGRWVGPPL